MAKGKIKTYKGRTQDQQRAFNKTQAKKMTVGKALDWGSIGSAVGYELANYFSHGDGMLLADNVVASYSGFDIITKQLNTQWLSHGYGPPVMRAAEKKVFKFFGVKGPRTGVKNMGDLLDYVTYFGATAFDAYANMGNPEAIAHSAIKTQYGTDMRQLGFAAIQPTDMVMKKWVPYILQKKARQFMKSMGIKMPKLSLGG